ncbi:MAG TPA: hypothetical protein VF844_02115 [Ktedonobacteraceae bacterium]
MTGDILFYYFYNRLSSDILLQLGHIFVDKFWLIFLCNYLKGVAWYRAITTIWQLSNLPSVSEYSGATLTGAFPRQGNRVSSKVCAAAAGGWMASAPGSPLMKDIQCSYLV